MSRRFQPGLVPTLVALSLAASFAALGVWQLRRHEWRKEWLAERHARIAMPPLPVAQVLEAPDAHRDRRARARGQLLHEETRIVHDLRDGREGGVTVLTPLRLEPGTSGGDGTLLLVDRGTLPAPEAEAFLESEAGEETGPVEVVGLARPLRVQPAEPGTAPKSRRWARFDAMRPDAVARLQRELPRPLAPVWLQAATDPAGRLAPVPVVLPSSPVDHVSYALFWLALSVAALLHWVGFGIHRARQAEREADRATLRAGGAPGTGGEGDGQ